MHPGGPAPVLTDGTVTLRAHRRGDVPDLVAMCRDPEMIRWTTVPDPYSVQDAEAYISQTLENRRSGTPLGWAIDASGRFSGNVDLRLDGARGAELGYALAPWARHQRVLSRALRLLLSWAFENLDLDVVRWRAEVGNWPSRRVAWAVGFTVDGRQRGLLPARGAAHGEPPRDAWVATLRRGDGLHPAHPWLTPPVIRADGLMLRPHAAPDVPRIAEACDDPVTRRFLPMLPSPYTTTDARAYLQSVAEDHAAAAALHWAVADPADETLLGTISVTGLDAPAVGGAPTPSAEIGYWTHPRARGSGVTTRALRMAARHALLPAEDGGLGLRAVHLRAASDNTASQRVAAKAGFRLNGLLRAQQLNRDGSTSDLLHFDLTADELP